jgi:hypothetical protein
MTPPRYEKSGLVRKGRIFEGSTSTRHSVPSERAKIRKALAPSRTSSRSSMPMPVSRSTTTKVSGRFLLISRDCGLTTQAQRPGPRDATIANPGVMPGSLQRMVRRQNHSNHKLVPQLGLRNFGIRVTQAANTGVIKSVSARITESSRSGRWPVASPVRQMTERTKDVSAQMNRNGLFRIKATLPPNAALTRAGDNPKT